MEWIVLEHWPAARFHQCSQHVLPINILPRPRSCISPFVPSASLFPVSACASVGMVLWSMLASPLTTISHHHDHHLLPIILLPPYHFPFPLAAEQPSRAAGRCEEGRGGVSTR
eukprot:1158129-Pelagomonas_calceolata.AAC.10